MKSVLQHLLIRLSRSPFLNKDTIKADDHTSAVLAVTAMDEDVAQAGVLQKRKDLLDLSVVRDRGCRHGLGNPGEPQARCELALGSDRARIVFKIDHGANAALSELLEPLRIGTAAALDRRRHPVELRNSGQSGRGPDGQRTHEHKTLETLLPHTNPHAKVN